MQISHLVCYIVVHVDLAAIVIQGDCPTHYVDLDDAAWTVAGPLQHLHV